MAGATQTETPLLRQHAAGVRVDWLDDIFNIFPLTAEDECKEGEEAHGGWWEGGKRLLQTFLPSQRSAALPWGE